MQWIASGLPVRSAEGRRSPADPCHTTVRTGPYTAVRVGCANSHRSTSEVPAIGSKHWKAQPRGPWPEPSTKGHVHCQPCYWRVADEPPATTERRGDGAVFSIAATSLPAVAIGPSGSGTLAHRAFRRSRNSCANPADTELVPLSSSPC